MYKHIAIIIIALFPSIGYGQLTASYTEANSAFNAGQALFDQSLYGQAKQKFAEATMFELSQFEEKNAFLSKRAFLMAAKSALRGNFPEGEKLMLDFYHNNRPHPLAYEAVKELGDLRFEQKRYTEALAYYEYIEVASLPEDIQTEILFKKGYTYFVNKDFETAARNFKPILGKDTEFYYSTYYYMAMIHFFENDYEQAIEYFFIVENFPEYKQRIPYYIAQIYFAEQKYEDILTYIPSQIQSSEVKNLRELRHILGQTYFLLNKFEEALPHLEYFESQSRKMRQEDFYQLAFTQYQLGLYEKATENFKELSNLETDLGQFSNNYLADAYLKIGKKEEARISFKNVMDYQVNLDMVEEATFNYGKLSAELGYDRAAIKTLMVLPPTAKDYAKAQSVLGSLFESSKDYSMVIKTIEDMDVKGPKILKAYQKVILELGIQLINDGKGKLAIQTLERATESPVDNYFSAIIYYHLGDLYHQEGEISKSVDYLNKYFTLANLVGTLPSSADLTIAYYLKGYNYLKLGQYNRALEAFYESKNLMYDADYLSALDSRKGRMYADVLTRLGDAHFKENQYALASEQYELASEITFSGQDYAFFQRSMIQGLQGNQFKKIILLEQLIQIIPNSSFVDDAYFQMGETQLALNNSRAAELSFEKIIQLAKKSNLITRSLLKLGLIAYNKGDITTAIGRYEEIFKNNPNKAEAQEALLALEEIYIQDLGKADDYMSFVEKSTGYQMTSYERDSLSYIAAQGRFDNGEYEIAIESYTKYIDQFPNGINRLKALYNRAESHTILKEYSKALPDYDAVISAGQSDYYEDAIFKAALISYNDVQKFEESFNYYMLLSEVTSDELLQYESQVGALRSAYRFNNTDAVLVMANRVVGNPLANKEDKALAYFFSGKMNFILNSWEAATANFQQVILLVQNENAAESSYLLNDILYRKGLMALAEERTLETVSNSTAYPYWVARNLILYADIMVDRVDLFNARAALEAVLENFPESEELQSEAKAKLSNVKTREQEMNRLEDNSNTIELDTIKGNE